MFKAQQWFFKWTLSILKAGFLEYCKPLFPALCRKGLSTTKLPRGSRDIESTQNKVADI